MFEINKIFLDSIDLISIQFNSTNFYMTNRIAIMIIIDNNLYLNNSFLNPSIKSDIIQYFNRFNFNFNNIKYLNANKFYKLVSSLELK
ncbi:MAG: hypothetical protein WC860_08935 [Candidatus Margulisiibacteriota bacterium]|jgi:hypothetical protein